MKGTRLKFNVVMLLLVVVYAAILILGNVFHVSVAIASEEGSYASEFAEENKLTQVEMPDNWKESFTLSLTGEEADAEYAYNVHGDEIEIVAYLKAGVQEVLVIPSYIDEMAVTEVSMDLLGKAEIVVIPETVKEITGKVSAYLYTPLFFVEFVFTLISFLTVLVVVNVLLPRFKKKEEILLNSPQIVLSFVYILLQTGFSLLAIYSYITSVYVAFVMSLVMWAGYLILILSAQSGRRHAIEVEQRVEAKTEKMKIFKLDSKGLTDGITDIELKKQVMRLVEDIQYSDPVSVAELNDIENRLENSIVELREAIQNGEIEKSKELCDKSRNLLKERNEQCKHYKKR